jgi:hypothetical protein
MNKRQLAIVVTVALWVLVTLLCWVGYTGEDDLMYARYAYLFHRAPTVWWEFRMPAILAIRASFLLFGPSEFAAAIPSLLSSLAILLSVAWFVGWPRTLTWQTQSAVLVAAFIPIDVGFRSYPAAHQIAAGLLAVGTACLLKGGRQTKVVGSVLLAMAFMTHEISIFYLGLLCMICLFFDARTYLRPVVWCAAAVVIFVAVESVVYLWWLGDPLARFKMSAGGAASVSPGDDPDVGLSGLSFYLWPVRNVVFAKHFGIDLLLLMVCGVFAWPRFDRTQRILFTTTVAVCLWLGYGTQVPWAYSPLSRQYHYYNSLTLGIAALLPFAIGYALQQRARMAVAVIALALSVHVASLAVSGRWGAPVGVARALLHYADEHRGETFLTDVNTMNQMYVLDGFRMPDNVICLNGPAVEMNLLLNKEPASTPRVMFPVRPVTGVLINREQRDLRGFEPEFSSYVAEHGVRTSTIVDTEYRWPFVPLVRFVKPHGFMIRSAGGELVTVRADGANVATSIPAARRESPVEPPIPRAAAIGAYP